ncbi:MAG: ParB N-terminal domain-containing protein [Terriglobales bacterium]
MENGIRDLADKLLEDEDQNKILLRFISPSELFPHEEVDNDNVTNIICSIQSSRKWIWPIIVEEDSLVVIDGHHRRAAAVSMKLSAVPCLMLSYNIVAVRSMRQQYICAPNLIIANGKARNLYPPKTTKHEFPKLPIIEPIDIEYLGYR